MKFKNILFILISISMYSQEWIVQNSGFTNPSRGINQIEIVNTNIVWALAYDGSGSNANVQEFTRTTDGGSTWTPGIIDVGAGEFKINNISAVSSAKAWVSALDPVIGQGVIYSTNNSGLTWTQQNASGFQNATSFINGVIFFNENEGVAFGDPINGEFEIYTTSNGGTSWSLVNGANIPNPLSGEYGYNGGNIKIGNTLYLPTNKGRILKSIDKGLNWTILVSPISDFGGTTTNGRMSFSNESNGLILKNGDTNNLYFTTDGGFTWSNATTSSTSYKLLSYIPNTNTIIASSQNATTGAGSEYSTNNGLTYTSIDLGVQRGITAFINPTTGWCAGFNTSSTVGGIFKYSGPALSNQDFNTNNLYVSVYPNPVSNVLNFVTQDNTAINSVAIMDISGKEIIKSKAVNSNSIDVSSLQAGVYFVKFTSDDKSTIKKFIKE